MNEYKKLPMVALTNVDKMLQPAWAEPLGLNANASEILTDFRVTRPFMVEQSITIPTAKELMARAHVRLQLVIDPDEHFKGVITLADMLSVKVMQARERTGLEIHELSVVDVMTPRADLHGIDIHLFNHATIGDILVTMQSFGDQHLLVLDEAADCIRGIVSSSDIARALHEPVYIAERASTFSDIYQAVRG